MKNAQCRELTHLPRKAIAQTIADASKIRFTEYANLGGNMEGFVEMRDGGRNLFMKETFGADGSRSVKSHYQSYGPTFAGATQGIRWALLRSKAAIKFQAAGCGEVAAWVYCKLYQVQSLPFEVIEITAVPDFGNHTFIVMGLAPGDPDGKLTEHRQNTDAVICDPWVAAWLVKVGKQWQAVFSVDEYLTVCEGLTKDWSIKRRFRVG